MYSNGIIMAYYELIQYGCDNCGKLSAVQDSDKGIPKGWVFGDNHRICYCPECAKKLGYEVPDK